MITRRENETVTQFAMRQIRNEILEQAAKVAVEANQPGNQGRTWDQACIIISHRIRKLKDED